MGTPNEVRTFAMDFIGALARVGVAVAQETKER